MLSGLQHALGERSGPLAFHSDMNGMLGAISNSISILSYSSTQEAGGSPDHSFQHLGVCFPKIPVMLGRGWFFALPLEPSSELGDGVSS